MNEAELLFSEILNCDRLGLYLNKDLYLGSDKSVLISLILKRRIYGEPLAYILGRTEFMGLDFKVSKDVFIPRPETEILVETVLKYAYRTLPAGRQVSPIAYPILELGTGSGCIAISLAKYLPNINLTATDISPEALKIAEENARFNSVEDKIIFLKSNLFESLAISDMRYAICVSNPPYIPSAQINQLQPEIRYEPRIALDGGKDGLDFYGKIINQAPAYLAEGGFLIMEMGHNQAEEVKNIFQDSGNFKILEIVKDYNHINRVILAQKIGTDTNYLINSVCP